MTPRVNVGGKGGWHYTHGKPAVGQAGYEAPEARLLHLLFALRQSLCHSTVSYAEREKGQE